MFFKLIIKIKKRVLYWLNIISNRIVTIGFIIGFPGDYSKVEDDVSYYAIHVTCTIYYSLQIYCYRTVCNMAASFKRSK